MIKVCIAILLICSWPTVFSQKENPVQPGSTTEQQLENLTEQQEGETEDDTFLQNLDQFRRNPLDLNTVTADELRELRLISDLRIQQLVSYRQLLGKLISIYELQSVPGWDVEIINRVLPFVRVGSAITLSEDIGKRLTGGQHSILIRITQTVEKSEGFKRPDSILNRYPGSPQRVFFRYKYSYRNLLQYGISGDKDAGEQFFKGTQKNGFDFYSFHFFARKIGPIKLLALGDYTVNLGQGLIHWQSIGFSKSPDITAIKRQADILRPYNSAGEFNFMRGAGITVGLKDWTATGFVSRRKLDGTFRIDTLQTIEDVLSNISVSSIVNSGYHRTPGEIAKKNTVTETSYGGNLSYGTGNLHVGINGIGFRYSVPIVKDLQLYNQYSISGNYWHNYSLDFSYTYRNIHVFGETAMDKNNSKALLTGLLASLDPKIDASLVYRNIESSYQTLYGSAFTEGTYPTNEKGLFLGLSIKPRTFLRIDAYADAFDFPWLRFRVDAPSKGSDYLLQVTYKPNKQVEVYTRLRSENKAINLSSLELPTRQAVIRPRQNWRINVSYIASKQVTLRSRAEIVWYDAREKERAEQGYLTYIEVRYKPIMKPLSLNGRIQYFETDGFDSRLYAYESDVLYSFSIPQFIGKGMRYYINLNYDVTKSLSAWFRWSQTIYSDRNTIGSSLDEIQGNKRSEYKVQVMYNF